VIRGKAVKLMGSHPVNADLVGRRQADEFPGPGACLGHEQGAGGSSRFYLFFNGMKPG
jgi:hypothetical protein